jgi:hypothetical protein
MPTRDTQDQQPQSQMDPTTSQPETMLDDKQVRTSGGLRYQQANREPGDVEGGAPRSSAPVSEPDLRQRAEEYGDPDPEEQATLHEQGYPKLGEKLPSRVTQVEHGPYAGGSQQGDTKQT